MDLIIHFEVKKVSNSQFTRFYKEIGGLFPNHQYVKVDYDNGMLFLDIVPNHIKMDWIYTMEVLRYYFQKHTIASDTTSNNTEKPFEEEDYSFYIVPNNTNLNKYFDKYFDEEEN